jgi:hypothetical protein
MTHARRAERIPVYSADDVHALRQYNRVSGIRMP